MTDDDDVSVLRFADPAERQWTAHAACAGLDPDLFFPDRNDKATARAARAVCATCTVHEACLNYALTNHEKYGVWGGMSERQRRKLRAVTGRTHDDVANVARRAIADGKPVGPVVGAAFGISAAAAQQAVRAARHAGHDIPQPPRGRRPNIITSSAECGTVAGYRQHGNDGEPACRPCLDAYAAWRRGRRAALTVVDGAA